MAHEALGRAIGVNGAAAPAPAVSLRGAMARFTFAVPQYARTLAGRVRHGDAESLERFLAALAPLDGVRVTGEKRADGTDGDSNEADGTEADGTEADGTEADGTEAA